MARILHMGLRLSDKKAGGEGVKAVKNVMKTILNNAGTKGLWFMGGLAVGLTSLALSLGAPSEMALSTPDPDAVTVDSGVGEAQAQPMSKRELKQMIDADLRKVSEREALYLEKLPDVRRGDRAAPKAHSGKRATYRATHPAPRVGKVQHRRLDNPVHRVSQMKYRYNGVRTADAARAQKARR